MNLTPPVQPPRLHAAGQQLHLSRRRQRHRRALSGAAPIPRPYGTQVYQQLPQAQQTYDPAYSQQGYYYQPQPRQYYQPRGYYYQN